MSKQISLSEKEQNIVMDALQAYKTELDGKIDGEQGFTKSIMQNYAADVQATYNHFMQKYSKGE